MRYRSWAWESPRTFVGEIIASAEKRAALFRDVGYADHRGALDDRRILVLRDEGVVGRIVRQIGLVGIDTGVDGHCAVGHIARRAVRALHGDDPPQQNAILQAMRRIPRLVAAYRILELGELARSDRIGADDLEGAVASRHGLR